MGNITVNDVIGLVIAFVVMGLLLPIGIGNIANFQNATVSINGSDVAISTLVDGTVITLVGTFIPIVGVINLIRKIV